MTADAAPGRSGGPGRAGRAEIVSLALPALGVLAAEPLYVLVDTAVVGHLGALPLGALGVGGVLLSQVAAQGNFLAYGTTGRAARLFGAGRRADAVAEGVAASWLAVTLGLVVAALGELLANPAAHLVAGSGAVARAAERWLRVAVLGAPFILLTVAGNGWMRGVRDTRRPLRYVVGANLLSAALCPLLVYPAGLGLTGSAVANVVAQVTGAALFTRALLTELAAEGVPVRPRAATVRAQLVVARDLVARTLGMQACFLVAAGVAARMGTAQIAAHQIALQLWTFLALVLDSFAIAAQALVGTALGAGDQAGARATAGAVARLGGLAGAVFGLALLAGWSALPAVFTPDASVVAQAHLAWPWFAGMQPVAGVVFALDGVLLGAGDVRYLRTLTVAAGLLGFLPATLLAYALHLGLGGVWAGLTLFVLIRLVGMLRRTRDPRWALPGAPASG
ncbi:MAG TPA: MATE family efflux transporter [Mycobacteriales bacterium]|nr:MATE family efflux transporter [Mycobacteriales bacterium]